MTPPTQIDQEIFDSTIKSNFTEVSTSALGAKVIACSDDFFASKDNLIKATPSISLKGQFGPNGALYDGWESRRHNPEFDWVIIRLAPHLSHLHYVDIDTSHFSGNEAPASSVFGLRLDDATVPATLSPEDKRWEQILPVVTLGPNSRHIFKLSTEAQEGVWSALMVRMIPDGGMARFRAYGIPLAPALLSSIPEPSEEPMNLLSPLVAGRIVACSDANFSPPINLLLSGRGHDMSDGWETRRSQVGRGKYGPGGPLEGQERKEWVVARLGATGVLRHIEVDSAYHVGNYPVAVAIEATLSSEDVPADDAKWITVVAKKPLGPHRQHWFDIERHVPSTQVFSHVRCSIFPDGGLKRLRVFGFPIAPSTPVIEPEVITLQALPLTYEAFKPYGQVIQGFDLPTSAPKGVHVNIANQGTAFKFHRLARVAESYPEGMLKKGGLAIGCVRAGPQHDVTTGASIPVKVLERHAATTQAFIPMGGGAPPGTHQLSPGGAYIVVAALNGADDQPDPKTLRAFLATAAQGVSYNEGTWHHPLLTVNEYLDYACVEAQVGEPGLKMDCEMIFKPWATVQVAPYKAAEAEVVAQPSQSKISQIVSQLPSISLTGAIHPVPITHEAFAPFGQLIRAYPNFADAPAGTETNENRDFNVFKHNRLGPITNTYSEESGAVTGVAVFRATKKVGLERGKIFDVKLMERHPYTSQAFIPMGKAEWNGKGEKILSGKGSFLVIVADNGPDDRPDPATIKSFIMESGTGLNYNAGTWHHPVLVLDETLDLACVETQVSTGIPQPDARDCELLEWNGDSVFGRVAVPNL